MLKLRSTNEVSSSNGKILNLLSNDSMRIEAAFLFAGYVLIGPFETVALVYLLTVNVDFTILAGLPLLIAVIPLQTLVGHILTRYKLVYLYFQIMFKNKINRCFFFLRIKTAKITDERINMTTEILNGIKIIKMYCWEKPFHKLIHQIRK
jgi:ATP-binding cassette subfamily C (CFTR/MRP) protein 4